MITPKTINLSNINFLAFDCYGNQQPLFSTKAKIWLASACFESLNTTLTQQQKQKLAVRKLASKLIAQLSTQITAIEISQAVSLDDSHYPYRLQPFGHRVSFSHSQQQVACAITSSQMNIGIDVELNGVSDKVCQRYFHRNELSWLQFLKQQGTIDDDALCQQARQLLWMLKEGSIKAFNTGQLISGLKTDVSLPAQRLLLQYQQHLQDTQSFNATTAFCCTQSGTPPLLTTGSSTYIYLPYLQLVVVMAQGD
ncbi:4'-phosphopantetheinyl transferase family protein [Psychrobacter lutiphocae]|uniref:4'-phosphopantetheinyl transferase family protein n=1 Tax=Psychrobacter lutiphocae TaxID=540500 RepID=UPI0003771468|nr:4'-phosphopantetheinyl transferase superfamily protein [Psychrobacter lutiphocae]